MNNTRIWTLTKRLGVGAAVLLCALARAEVQGPMKIEQDATHLTISADGQTMLRYHYTDVPFKPYVQELYSPRGFDVVREAPPDHLHHHGLMFAVAVDGVDFWAETPECGREIHRTFPDKSAAAGGGSAAFTETLDWVRPSDNATLLNERRTITATRLPDLTATLITWVSELACAPPLPKVTVSGSHYFGLGMRFPASMDAIGTFRNAAGNLGEIVRGEERNGRANWSCYSAVVDGQPVTVAMFDDPANARHPATWFTMPVGFAYMSATLDLKHTPLPIEAGRPLVLRYGVAVWDAAATDAQIEDAYQRWLALPRQEKQK